VAHFTFKKIEMKKSTYYFSHDYHARTDGKLIKVMMKQGISGIGIYWCLIEMLYENEGSISINEYERIAFELRTNIESITSVIHDFALFEPLNVLGVNSEPDVSLSFVFHAESLAVGGVRSNKIPKLFLRKSAFGS